MGTAKGQSRRSDFTFAQIPSVGMQRSVFNRSHGLKTTFDESYLVPVFVDECLPGDSFNLRTSALIRMTTPLFPLLDDIFVDFFFFACPYRLVWENWEKFCGAQDDPGDSIIFTVPEIQSYTPPTNAASLSNYLGIPVGNSIDFNSLHHRAYNLIWNEWFRDEDLQDSVVVDTDNGPDAIGDYVLLKRGKRHDYFSACRPWTQKGTAVDLPLGTSAPVTGTIDANGDPTFDSSTITGGRLLQDNVNLGSSPAGERMGLEGSAAAQDWLTWNDPALDHTLVADLSSATAATINEIREAFQVQRLLERDARAGTRYTEILRSHFGVISPDARLQRPEYLGGGSTRMNINPVALTADTTGAEVGDLTAFGLATCSGIGFTKSFSEHCLLLGLVNVRANLSYQEGLPRMFSRQTRYDYYWPSLAHLGEQQVKNKEIYSQGIAADENTFGYIGRYDEYRYKPSMITGLMNSRMLINFDEWHLGLDFSSLPVLNSTFIEDDPPIDRVVAAPSEPHFKADFFFDLKCARPMPTFGVPGLIDHF